MIPINSFRLLLVLPGAGVLSIFLATTCQAQSTQPFENEMRCTWSVLQESYLFEGQHKGLDRVLRMLLPSGYSVSTVLLAPIADASEPGRWFLASPFGVYVQSFSYPPADFSAYQQQLKDLEKEQTQQLQLAQATAKKDGIEFEPAFSNFTNATGWFDSETFNQLISDLSDGLRISERRCARQKSGMSRRNSATDMD